MQPRAAPSNSKQTELGLLGVYLEFTRGSTPEQPPGFNLTPDYGLREHVNQRKFHLLYSSSLTGFDKDENSLDRAKYSFCSGRPIYLEINFRMMSIVLALEML